MQTEIIESDSRTLGKNHRVVVFKPLPGQVRYSEPILSIHGMWGTDLRWSNFGRYFAGRGFRFAAPSLRYHHPGNEIIKELGRTSVLDYVEDLIYLIRKMGLGMPVVIGHSMGGLLAMKLAAEGLASKLILINSAPPAGISLRANWLYQLSIIRYLPKILLRKPFKPSFRLASYYVLNGMPKERRLGLYQGLVHESGTAAWEIRTGKIKVDFDKINCPVLVIGCGEDRIVPPAVAKDIYGRMEYAFRRALKIYQHHAHWPQMEYQWEDIADDIIHWLAFNL